VVFCFSGVNQGIGSFQTLVQSEEFTPEQVFNSTVDFLANFYSDTVLSQNFTDDFPDKVEVLRQSLNKRDLKLEDKTMRVWTQVQSGQRHFDFREQQLELLNVLDAEKFSSFYESLLLRDETQKRLVVVVYGEDKDYDPPAKDLIDYWHLNPTSTILPILDVDLLEDNLDDMEDMDW
jgi:secreted Zn-dependent insulinase-like peptidase